ncbi:hypothetical protein ACWYXK_29025 [Janthinobacterium lividum]
MITILSVFQGMVIPGIESLGISPFFIAQIAVVLYALVYWRMRGLIIPKEWYWFTFWFTAFVIFSAMSAFVFPFVFQGIHVYVPKGGIDEQYLSPGKLQISSSNIAQAVFILLYWLSIILLVTNKSENRIKIIGRAYVISAIIVLFFSFYQLISILTGIPYPGDYLLNNTSYGIAQDATFGFLPRINSTFTEPSFYAMFVGSFASWLYIRLLNEDNSKRLWAWGSALCIALLGLLLSASSTGYLSMLIFFACHSVVSIFSKNKSTHNKRIFIIISGCALFFAIFYMFVPGTDVILSMILFDKGESESSLHRFAADAYAFTVLENTAYFGAGLGSNRPSSFITFLISNVGIIGMSLILLTTYVLWKMGVQANNAARLKSTSAAVQASGWALFTMLVSKAVAGADLSFPPMWILIIYFISCISHAQAERKKYREINNTSRGIVA